MAGLEQGEGWPGWDVVMPWLDRKVTTAELVTLAEALGVQAEDLDDEVHDMAQAISLGELNGLDDEDDQEDHISAQEAFASAINNQGLTAQIAFLLKQWDAAAVERVIRDVAR